MLRAVTTEKDMLGTSETSVSGGENRLGKTGLTFEIRDFTPDMSAMLAAENDSVDGLDDRAINAYADAMQAGAWIYNAQPILFDRDGKLIDGIQRLIASARSGSTFRSLVVNGLQRDTVHTLDQHRRRSYAGVLEARGISNAGSLIRSMAKLIRIERGEFGKPTGPISWARYDQVLDNNENIQTAVEISEAYRGCPLHSSARPAVIYIAMQAGHLDVARDLMEKMSDHSDLDRGHPAKELALQLAHDRARGLKPDVDEMIAMGLQALDHMVRGIRPEAPYGWTRDFGSCVLGADGAPMSRRSYIEDTPANLGLPLIDGYPGIDLGGSIVMAKSQMFESLRAAGAHVPAQNDLRLVHLTPDVAAQWLERYNGSNRKIQSSHVNAIARDILAGNWMMNAQPIAFHGNPFAGDALLLNGQHRLQACVKADAEIEVLVASGIAKEAFATFDIQGRRSRKKYVAKGDERVLAAAAKLQWRVDNGLSPMDRETPSALEIRQTIEAHSELVEAFPVSRKKEMQDVASAGILTFFIAHIRREDDQLAETFLTQLMNGEGLVRGNPLIRARTLLIGKRGDMTRRDVLKLLLDTWDEYRGHADVVGVQALTGGQAKVVEFV